MISDCRKWNIRLDYRLKNSIIQILRVLKSMNLILICWKRWNIYFRGCYLNIIISIIILISIIRYRRWNNKRGWKRFASFFHIIIRDNWAWRLSNWCISCNIVLNLISKSVSLILRFRIVNTKWFLQCFLNSLFDGISEIPFEVIDSCYDFI